jgi:hypothetical protein
MILEVHVADAVAYEIATMDTVTLVRSAIRGLLAACDRELEGELRGLLGRDDDYRRVGKPVCHYEDPEARQELVDGLAKDARALLAALDGRELEEAVAKAAALLASVVGQDLDEGEDGAFRIARRVARDRIISTVDPDVRHGHKTSARGFDGYKGHVAVDPDSELVISTAVTAGNVGDAAAAEELLAADLQAAENAEAHTRERTADAGDVPEAAEGAGADDAVDAGEATGGGERLSVYGDSAYGSGEVLARLEQADAEINCKVQQPVAPGGRFRKSEFQIDLDAGKVTCPAEHTVQMTVVKSGHLASFGGLCAGCPLAEKCTSSPSGRTIHIGLYERQLAAARARQSTHEWKQGYTQTRPKIERKIAQLMRRKHGARRARVRGRPKVSADFQLLAAATNLARLAVLGLTRHTAESAISTG